MGVREVMDRYLGAASAGDWDTGFGIYAEDVVFHIPGSSHWAGEHHGRDRARAYIEEAIARSDGAEIEIEIVDRLYSDERAAVIIHERFTPAGGEPVWIRRSNVYRVRGDEIAEVWIYEHDQAAVDALFA